MKKSGYATTEYVDKAVRHVLLKSGILGLKVSIMLPWDPTGKRGPKKPLPDVVHVLQPKKEDLVGGQ
jgi:ribosomal protein S3